MDIAPRSLLSAGLLVVLGACGAPEPDVWSPYGRQGEAWGYGDWEPDVDEIGKQLSNPISQLPSFSNTFAVSSYDGSASGAEGESSGSYLIQASVPLVLSRRSVLRIAPTLPVYFDRPFADDGGSLDDTDVTFGDLRLDLAYGGTTESGLILLGGVVATLPTSDETAFGGDQLQAGAQAAIGKLGEWGLAGLSVSHVRDVSGADYETQVTGGSYFYALGLGSGWQIAASPIWAYDHEAPSAEAWSVPIGVGLARTMMIRGTPWRFSVQYWHYVESEEILGLQSQVRIGFSPVVAMPFEALRSGD